MRTLLLSVVGLAIAAPLSAQMIVTQGGPGGPGQRRMNLGGGQPALEEAPNEYGVRAWRVGQFARYSISINMGQMPLQQFRQVSIVGQSGERFWVETSDEFAGGMSSRGPVTKMLIPFGQIRERVGTEIISMTPDSAIYRRTLVRAGSGGGPQGIEFPGSWTRVGDEQVTVAAGQFQAVHWRKGSENLWTSGEAGPMGLVKYESDTTIIELTGRGDNARSRIPFGG